MRSKAPIRPPRLARGSRIALVAPAGPLLERDDLTRAEALCRALGYEPRLGPNTAERYGYFAGTDEQRLADLIGQYRATMAPALPTYHVHGSLGDVQDVRRKMKCSQKPLLDYFVIATHYGQFLQRYAGLKPSSRDCSSLTLAVRMASLPPPGMASRALTARLMMTCSN